VQATPDDARVLFNASLPYLKMQNNGRAVELLMRAAELDTSAEASYRGRAYKISGPILINLGRAADAQRVYKWLVDREPGVCDHLQWYAFTFFSQKQYQTAIPHLKRAYDCFEKKTLGGCPQNELRWWLAYATYETATADTQKDEAYKLCEQVIKCDPKHKDAKVLMDRIDEEIEEVGSN
jgi:tetratricopeptide (TPR) repeat protein